MYKKFIQTTIVTAILCFLALPAYALTYYFNTANTIGTWSGDPTTGYGSVEITKTADDIKFEIKANEDYFITDSSERSGLTWDKFFFNFNPDKTLDTSSVVIESDGAWRLIEDSSRNVASFGIFDYAEVGRRLPLMLNPLEFTIRDTPLDILDFVFPNLDNNYFAGHLRRFGEDNEDSIYLAVAPVPEPGTLILIGSGLGGLLLYRRRRASN